MTPDQLRSRLDSLDLGITQFARMIGVDRTAVHKWLAGHRKVPGPVVAYLELYASLDNAQEFWAAVQERLEAK